MSGTPLYIWGSKWAIFAFVTISFLRMPLHTYYSVSLYPICLQSLPMRTRVQSWPPLPLQHTHTHRHNGCWVPIPTRTKVHVIMERRASVQTINTIYSKQILQMNWKTVIVWKSHKRTICSSIGGKITLPKIILFSFSMFNLDYTVSCHFSPLLSISWEDTSFQCMNSTETQPQTPSDLTPSPPINQLVYLSRTENTPRIPTNNQLTFFTLTD